MKHWKQLLVPAMAFSLLSPVALRAVEGETEIMEEVTPTFQNPAQAERAANLASASITSEEVADLEKDASSQAEGYANSFAEDYANDQADQHVKDVSRNYANEVVNIEPERDERFRSEADLVVQTKAEEYARGVNEDIDSLEYKQAYEAAIARATDPSFNNLWDTTYKQLIEEELTLVALREPGRYTSLDEMLQTLEDSEISSEYPSLKSRKKTLEELEAFQKDLSEQLKAVKKDLLYLLESLYYKVSTYTSIYI